jgi:L-asparaginase II
MVCALDGCTAPIYSIPIYNQAIAFKNLAEPSQLRSSLQLACNKIIEIVGSNPYMIAGADRYCTEMMQVTAPKIIGKTGAEGVFCMSFTEQKYGVCIKIDDGKMLPQYQVAQALVEASRLFTQSNLEPIHSYAVKDIKNYNKLTTGETLANTELINAFSALF